MKIETTKEKILKAAKVSENSKKVLEKLFPEVFKEGIITQEEGKFFINRESILIDVRGTGNLMNKSIYLHADFDWQIKKDDKGCKCLIPTRK